MRAITLSIILILLASIVSAESWMHQSQELEIDLDISSEIELIKTSSSYSVDYVTATLSFYPTDSFQQTVLSLETQPQAIENKELVYRWEDPELGELEFNLDSEIKTKNTIQKVYNKVNFPITTTEELEQYTLATENIDSNQEIISLASSLAQGEDDLYKVIFNIADWVSENIEYDITCGTRVEKASWVLTNKRGTCDEFTSLFIALTRALGIPAKYISGIAYSNLPDIEGFGNHAWAEVYFPDHGWIPFDTTYGEFGFVDASHIALKESLDSDESSVKYQWKGRNIELETEKLDVNAELKEQKGQITAPISLEIIPIKESVGFGSYNLIQATIQNLNSYYIATELSLAKSAEVDIIDNINQHVLLEPQEKKNMFWITRLDEDLETDYAYTLPIAVYSTRNVSASTSFTSSYKDATYSKEQIKEILEQNIEEEEKIYSKEVELICTADKQELYMEESAEIECTIKNKGNTLLGNLNVCLDKICKTIDLGIAQQEEMDFEFKPTKTGTQDQIITAKNPEITKSTTLAFDVLDKPGIVITDIQAPSEVEFKQEYTISFKLDKTSFSAPQDIVVNLVQDSFSEQWQIQELAKDRVIKINMVATDLKKGQNKFDIIVEYQDKKGNKHEVKEEFHIELTNVTFLQNIQIFLNRLGRKLANIF